MTSATSALALLLVVSPALALAQPASGSASAPEPAAPAAEPAAPTSPSAPAPAPTDPDPDAWMGGTPAHLPPPGQRGGYRLLELDLGSASDGPQTLSARFADPAHHKLELDLEMFGTGAYTSSTGPAFSEFRLDRGEAGAIVGLGSYMGTELRLESIRSAANGGELGIDGDSIVVRVKRAQVFGDYDVAGTPAPLVLHGALGVTPDPWIMALETDYPLRPLSATASERVLGWPTSDLAGLGRVTYGPVRLSVSFGNGDGLDYPERNNGKTTTAVIEALPLDLPEARLRLAGVARDGSVGPARVRDRRFGGAATLWTPLVGAGAELVQAYGIADRGDLEALAVSGWAEVRPAKPLALVGRFSTIGYANGGGRASSFGGAVALEPWRERTYDHRWVESCDTQRHDQQRCIGMPTVGYARLWLALDRTTTSGAAMPIPGADSGAATTLLLIVSTTAPFTVN
jgi:hypothetical protein